MPEPVTFGLSLPNRAVLFGLPVSTLVESAEEAEASGTFDSVWVGDNLLSKPRLESIVLLSALATRTSRVKLGTVCLASFTFRHPITLAIQWASLDVVSGGRTILAVCAGAAASAAPKFAAELKAMGLSSRDRVPRMEESIDLVRRLWGPEPVTHEGRYFQLEDVMAYPKPIQEHIPVVLAVNPPPNADADLVERALRRVAKVADGWQSDGTPAHVFRERWSRVREYAAEFGRTDQVRHSSLHLMVNINDDVGRARQESVEFLNHYYGEGMIPPEKLEAWLALGPPSAVIEKIGAFLEAGCATPILRFTSPDQRGQLERCVTEVMPAFTRQTTPAGS